MTDRFLQIFQKPMAMLSGGMLIMLLSCSIILSLLFNLLKQHDYWGINTIFIALAVLIHMFSLGSSSFVEEEQYTWHFLACTLYLIFLFMGVQLFLEELPKRGNNKNLCSIIFVLICMRVVRGWCQGGVNWVHLPDISKSLEILGSRVKKTLHIGSLVVLANFSILAIQSSKSITIYRGVLIISHLISFLLVYLHIFAHQTLSSFCLLHGSLALTLGISLASPFLRIFRETKETGIEHLANAYLYIIGLILGSSWCLHQLFLQQPVNATPMLLIFLQLFASVVIFSWEESNHTPFIEVSEVMDDEFYHIKCLFYIEKAIFQSSCDEFVAGLCSLLHWDEWPLWSWKQQHSGHH